MTRQWTASPDDIHIPPVDNRVCKCGRSIGEHEWSADWCLVAEGCEGFSETLKSVVDGCIEKYAEDAK